MNLLITPSAHGQEYATALLTATRTKTTVVADVRAALHRLREDEFSAVVIDESLVDASSNQMEVFLKHLGTAVPVFVNLAVSRADRVSRDVVAALHRVEEERNAARKAAESELRSQLKDELTGILLWSEQALGVAGLPPAAEAKLRAVCELACRMRERLDCEKG
jgi:hypothetical protein